MFRRTLSMCLDTSLSTAVRTHLLSFLICAFQSLDNGLVRKECAPLVSISMWQNLASESIREGHLEKNAQLKKAWRASSKRYESAEAEVQARLRFERAWLFSLVLDFIGRLQVKGSGAWRFVAAESQNTDAPTENLVYCERFLEFLTDLESQLPTRRYVNTVLKDLNLLAIIRLSPMFNHEDHGLFRDLFVLFRHFVNFSIDDSTGIQFTRSQSYERHSEDLVRLQRTALKHFKSKLTLLALSNYGSIDQRSELEGHLSPLTETELSELCAMLGFRISYPSAAEVLVDHDLLMEVLVSAHERRKTFQETVRDLSTLPTEATLYEPTLLRNETYNGSRSLAIPKINLQYLSVGDFLWRAFVLNRCESFFEVRRDVEEVIKRLQPRTGDSVSNTRFTGFSKMAIPIAKPA